MPSHERVDDQHSKSIAAQHHRYGMQVHEEVSDHHSQPKAPAHPKFNQSNRSDMECSTSIDRGPNMSKVPTHSDTPAQRYGGSSSKSVHGHEQQQTTAVSSTNQSHSEASPQYDCSFGESFSTSHNDHY